MCLSSFGNLSGGVTTTQARVLHDLLCFSSDFPLYADSRCDGFSTRAVLFEVVPAAGTEQTGKKVSKKLKNVDSKCDLTHPVVHAVLSVTDLDHKATVLSVDGIAAFDFDLGRSHVEGPSARRGSGGGQEHNDADFVRIWTVDGSIMDQEQQFALASPAGAAAIH